MKKIFLYLTLLFSGASMAQLEKNTLFVGSFISPENQKFFNSYYYSYLGRTFTPSIGFMLSNKWALGTEFNFGFAFRESQQIYKNFYFSAFSRYYFINEKKFAMYVNVSSGYSLFQYKSSNIDYQSEKFPLKIGLGASYFLTNRISLDIQTNYILGSSMEGKIGIHYHFR